MSIPPPTPPGWYPVSPSGQLRWWDGYQWTPHVSAPGGWTPLHLEPQPEVSTRTAAVWFLALSPFALALLVGLLLLTDLSAMAVLTIFGVAATLLVPAGIGLALWDLATLQSRGSRVSMAHSLWVLLGAWIYLLIRALMVKGRDRERWVVLVVNVVGGFALGLVAVLGFIALLSDEDFQRALFYDETLTERQIQRGIEQDTGRVVEVDCPAEPPVGRGSSFDCTISNASGVQIGYATVTWEDDFGNSTWTATRGESPIDQA